MKFFFKTCFIFSSLYAGRISYDIDMSPYAGANNLLFATDLIEQIQPFKESNSWKARFGRFNELILFYLPLNYFTSIVQHEVFGHGYRIRDIDHGIVRVHGYQFTFPPPYGSGSASTRFSIDVDRITPTDLTTISIAGLEAQSILALQTKFNWLGLNAMDARESVLYLVSQFALNLYASGNGDDSHDLVGYIHLLNYTYTDTLLTEERIRNLSWINLADPFTYFSVYAWFHYLVSGKQTAIPMIPIKSWGYLFGARLGLTPFGPEYFFDHYLMKEARPIYFYLRAGAHSNNTYFGAGFYSPTLFKKKRWAFGGRLDVWRQPELLLFGEPPYSSMEQHQQLMGIASSVICSYQKNRWLGFETEIGFKTKGFVPGYSLFASPIIRISYLSSF
ncbi:MAG TPA: hypothetical protein VLE96_07420 [Chlamydiales bacterium]|nr:hypothetical protein [Chlamydiales bacterium]